MYSLVAVLALFGMVSCQPWAYHQQVHDTPEVAAAKAAHLAALAKANQEAKAHSWNENDRSDHEDDGSYREEHHKEASWQDDHSWESLPQEWNHAQQTHQPHWETSEKKWTGPIALPPGYDKHGAPLPVKDTPEVAAEKAKHFHLYAHGAHAAAAAAHSSPSHHNPSWDSHEAHSWH